MIFCWRFITVFILYNFPLLSFKFALWVFCQYTDNTELFILVFLLLYFSLLQYDTVKSEVRPSFKRFLCLHHQGILHGVAYQKAAVFIVIEMITSKFLRFYLFTLMVFYFYDNTLLPKQLQMLATIILVDQNVCEWCDMFQELQPLCTLLVFFQIQKFQHNSAIQKSGLMLR